MRTIVRNVHDWRKTEMDVRRLSIWVPAEQIYSMNGGDLVCSVSCHSIYQASNEIIYRICQGLALSLWSTFIHLC